MRRLIESLTPADQPIAWTWIGGMFAFYVAVMAVAATLYIGHQTRDIGHQTRANLAQKPGATVATGSASSTASEPGVLRSLQHVVHYRDDARVAENE